MAYKNSQKKIKILITITEENHEHAKNESAKTSKNGLPNVSGMIGQLLKESAENLTKTPEK